jgi:magnesium transporter
MIRSLYRTPAGQVRIGLESSELAAALEDGGSLLWLDLRSEPLDACEQILKDTFGFHPLAIDDALEESHVPKVDDWGLYLYLNLHGAVFDLRQEDDPLDEDDVRVDTGRDGALAWGDVPVDEEAGVDVVAPIGF